MRKPRQQPPPHLRQNRKTSRLPHGRIRHPPQKCRLPLQLVRQRLPQTPLRQQPPRLQMGMVPLPRRLLLPMHQRRSVACGVVGGDQNIILPQIDRLFLKGSLHYQQQEQVFEYKLIAICTICKRNANQAKVKTPDNTIRIVVIDTLIFLPSPILS